MDLSIIIINWNSVGYLQECLKSIYEETRSMQFEIIVVDNASYDGCEKVLTNFFPKVKFIQSKENIGFARANNLGYEHSSGKNILFINPDTIVLNSAIDIMYSLLKEKNDAGAVGCKVLNSDLTLDMSCVRPFPFIINSILESQYLITNFPNVRLWKSNPIFLENNSPGIVDVIIGACIMLRKNVFFAIEMFSTEYFMYSEDVDLCYKIKKAGWNIYYTCEANIIHYGGGSTKNKTRNDFKEVMIQDSRLKFIKKAKGKNYAILFRICTSIAAVSRLIIIAVMFVSIGRNDKKDNRKLSLYKWKKILTWSLGLETWVRKY